MNAASPDRPQSAEPQLANSQGSSNSSRGLLLTIMVVLLLWGVYLARGAFLARHNFWQAALVLICVAGFLCFWGVMLATRRARLAKGAIPNDDEKQYSKTCVTGFAASLLGFVFTLIALLLISRSALSDGLAYVSLILNPLGLLLSIIGLSNPRRSLGKMFGLATIPLTMAWGIAVILYAVS